MAFSIKKMLSKICTFGLAASMLFGFGSSLTNAIDPNNDSSITGTLATEGNYAVISINSTNSLYVKNVVGRVDTYDGSPKRLIKTKYSNLDNDNGDGLNVYWGNNFINDSTSSALGNNHNTVTANFGSIYLRAVNRQNNNIKTSWSKVWENGSLNPSGITAIVASAIGQYEFYYYIDSNLFSSDGTPVTYSQS